MSGCVRVMLTVGGCAAAGIVIGQLYYNCFIKDILLCTDVGYFVGLSLSFILALCNVLSVQVRCISLLLIPMYCGKAGRGVLKVVVLTYVIAGPITNMGLNAREVVRVFACSTQLSTNLSSTRYSLMRRPVRKALLTFTPEIEKLKTSFRSVRDVIAPIEQEIEDETLMKHMREENERIRQLMKRDRTSNKTKRSNPVGKAILNKYEEKMRCRCEHHLMHGVDVCLSAYAKVYNRCRARADFQACKRLMLPRVCDIQRVVGPQICENKTKLNSDLEANYKELISAQANILTHLNEIKIENEKNHEQEFLNLQYAKDTGDCVLRAFDEKTVILQAVNAMVDVFLASLVLRIAVTARTYHDAYLTDNDFDNTYITGYFKTIDERRWRRGDMSLLPLKKMEKNRYIDIKSFSFLPPNRSKFLMQILKVLLEAVTATTFVMLDRIFYEALEVVRRHAVGESLASVQDINIEVTGVGVIADMMRKILMEITENHVNGAVSNDTCVLRPRAIPAAYYVRIYAGYLWVLLLVYVDPYTLRLRRLICSYFYPKREKERILHLYNDILKKRMRLQKTLQRKAVQAVRVHYLSRENLLSLRMRFPQLLGWLDILPAARMRCLICGETEPRYRNESNTCSNTWRRCINKKCPFVYCEECWRESGRCLACDPALADLSDVDSLSDHPPTY